MELIDNLLKNISEDNSYIIKSISSIIINNNINTLEDLKLFQSKKDVINGKELSINDKINYAKNIINSFPYDIDRLDYDDVIKYQRYKDIINNSKVEEDIIINLIKIYDLTCREIYFPYEAYKYIIEKKI